MSKQLLNHPQVCIPFQHMAGEAVAQRVRMDASFESGAGGASTHYLFDAAPRQPISVTIDEERIGSGATCGQVGTAILQIVSQSDRSRLAEQRPTFFIALAAHQNLVPLRINIVHVHAFDLGQPNATRVQHFQNGLIAQTQGRAVVRSRQ